MLELIVAAAGVIVAVLGSVITTSIKIGGERQSREDLSTRHADLAKEVRGELAVLKIEKEHTRERAVELEKAILLLGQRVDATQSQLATRSALETERAEHLRQQLDTKASSEMVVGLKQQIEKISEKIDQLHEQLASFNAPAAPRRRPSK